jgi:hypothetical protein
VRTRRNQARSEPSQTVEGAFAAVVREEIEHWSARYVAAGAAELLVHRYGPEAGCDFEIIPSAPGAAAVLVSVGEGEVTVGVGNGVVEFRSDEHAQWRRDLGELLAAAADGRYEESITEGRIFERTVEMHFAGTGLGSVRYRNLSYEGNDPQDAAPAVGEKRYRAWLVADPAE